MNSIGFSYIALEGIWEQRAAGSNPVVPTIFSPFPSCSALFHEPDDGEGDLGGSRTFFAILMDYLRQRLHVLQPLKLPILFHIGMGSASTRSRM